MNTRKIIIYGLSALIGIGLLVFIWFYSTHGYIKINGDSIRSVEVIKLQSNGSSPVEYTSGDAIKNGTYYITVTKKDGNSYSQQADVPRFFGDITVDVKTSQNAATLITKESYSTVARANSTSVTTFDYIGKLKTTKNNDILGRNTSTSSKLPQYTNYVVISNGLVGGVIKSEDIVTPVFYDVEKNSTRYFDPIKLSSADSDVTIQSTSSGFMVFSKEDSTIYAYSQSESYKKIGVENYAVASSNNKPLIAFNKAVLAVTSGDDRISSPDNEQANKTNDYSITVLNEKNEELRSLSIDKNYTINTINLSNDNKYIAISTSTAMFIYEIETGEKLFTIPFQTQSFMWNLDDEFIFVNAANHELLSGNVQTKSAQSLINTDALNISELSFIDDSVLYFTAYSNKDEFRKKPDAYSINISLVASDNNQLLSQFPYQGDGYYIQALNNTLYVQLTRYVSNNGTFYDNDAYSKALKYIKNVLKDNNQYKVEKYFVDVDLRD